MNIFFEKPEEQKITSQRELVEHLLNNSGDVDEMSVILNGQSYVLADSCYFGYAESIGYHYVLFSQEEADPDLAGDGEVLHVL